LILNFIKICTMTKLLEWLSAIALLASVWLAVLTGKLLPSVSREHFTLVLASPVFAVVLFGLYALSVLVYRVATFNDCEDAARELREEIVEAKKDLAKNGLVVG
jgi:dolichyl-phosphate mannosyltransferase polypeptide 3